MASTQRRDTPAARAALARRRQRAAAITRPQSINNNAHTSMGEGTGFDRTGPLKVTINTTTHNIGGNDNQELPVKEVISSPGRAFNQRPSTSPSNKSNSRSNIPRYNRQPLQQPVKQQQNQNRLSPLAQRAVQSMHKSSPTSGGGNHTIDGTLTTYTASSASRSFSPVKKGTENYSNYYSHPANNNNKNNHLDRGPAAQTLKRGTEISEPETEGGPAYRTSSSSPYHTISSSGPSTTKATNVPSTSGKRLYDGRPGTTASATTTRDSSLYRNQSVARDTETSSYRKQSPTSNQNPPSPKKSPAAAAAHGGGGGRRTFESKSPGRPRSSFERRLSNYKKGDSRQPQRPTPIHPAETDAPLHGRNNHRVEDASPPRRRVEPSGRGAGEDPLSASQRKKAALSEARKQANPYLTGASPPQQQHRNSSFVEPSDESIEEGPLSARRMKMEAADSQQKQHQLQEQNKNSFTFVAQSSPRQTMDTTRRASPSPKNDHPHRSNFGDKPASSSQQPQLNNSSRTSPRRNGMQQLNGIPSEADPTRRKLVVLSPQRDVKQSSPQSKSIFESAFSTSRMAVSPSSPERAGNNYNGQVPILRKSISPRRPSRNLPPSGRNGFSSPPRPNGLSSPPRTITHLPENNVAGEQEEYFRDHQEPMPGRRQTTTSTPWMEKSSNISTNPPSSMIRQRPPPIDTGANRNETHGTIPSRHQPPQRIVSPRRQENSYHDTAPPQRLSSSPYRSPAKGEYQTTGTSPGVQQLSTLLMDSSFATDVSTIAEMHYPRAASPAPVVRKNAQKVAAVPMKADNYRSPQKRQYDEEDHDELEDQLTADGRNHHLIDSACLDPGSFVMLKAYSIGTSIEARKSENSTDFLAEPRGLCLGRDDELFKVTKVTAHGADQTDPLRHGDTILFHSSLAQKMLGVRKGSRGAIDSPLELGFLNAGAPPGAEWTVLIARNDKEVLVGRAAVANHQQYSTNPGGTMASLVRSGDPVLLRNNHTGGILSIDSSGSLALLTDSYNQSTSGDPSLLQRLQHHDRLLPSRNETFQLVSYSTPPCPTWISGRDADERIFLTGSYLLQPQRNQRSAAFESNLFVANAQPSILSRRMQGASVHLSSGLKEKILLDEVIGSFLGLEGKHVRLKAPTGRTLCLDDFEFQLFDADGVTFDVSLRNLVDQILPLSTSFVRVQNFVSSHHPGYEYGKVMHAFCEGLDSLLQDYVTFVAQIERQFRHAQAKSDALTMKNVYFQITPSLHSMSILEHVTKAVAETKGGALINTLRALDTRVYMGDVVAKKVLSILLERASVPYMSMMTMWLQSGLLQDPYEEFMIGRSQTGGSKSHYTTFDGDAWTALFVINEEHVLEIVSPDLTKKKVMTTGKYWNAIQACHTDEAQFRPVTDGRHVPALPQNSDSSALSAYIDAMYRSASRALVQLLMNDFKLMESLQVMKRYFLLDQGDFLMNFLDASGAELAKDFENISIGRVQHWLSMSIQLAESPREDEQGIDLHQRQRESCKLTPSALRCRFRSDSLTAHLDALSGKGGNSRRHYGASSGGLTGIEAFSLDFARVAFPTSLVLSQHTMENYKLLFRHLFFAKHVERRLVGVWRDHQSLKSLHSLRGLLGRTFLLRQRMLHFVQNLLYYMSFEVIESNWTDMLASIDPSSVAGRSPNEKEQTVDDILDIHNNFLRRTMDACLLTNRELFQSLTKLMNTCLMFSDQMKRFMESTRIHDDNINIAIEKRRAVQRSLNDRGAAKASVDKKALRQALVNSREEREAKVHRQTRRVTREVSGESYMMMVARFDEVFISDLSDFMLQLNSNTATGTMANLGIRLSDYNGYIATSMNR